MHREKIFTHPKLNTADLINVIREKIESHASKGSDQIRQLLIRFKKPEGGRSVGGETKVSVDITRFHQQVKQLGVMMTKEQTNNVFNLLDVDQSGSIDIIEFLSGMSNDYSGTTYFETRPASRNHGGHTNRLGGSKFNRPSQMVGCSMALNDDHPPNKYQDYVPGYKEMHQQRREDRLSYEKDKKENQQAKQLREQMQRRAHTGRSRVEEEEVKERGTGDERSDAIPIAPETPIVLPPVIQSGQRKSPRMKSSPRMISPRQQEKLQQMLRKSMGNGGGCGGGGSGTKGAMYPLRSVVTKLDIQSGKASARGLTPRNVSTKVPMSSPRTWTQILREGDQRNVWKDTSDADQCYQTRFQGKQSLVPKPPGAAMESKSGNGRGRGRRRGGGRMNHSPRNAPRYYKHRE